MRNVGLVENMFESVVSENIMEKVNESGWCEYGRVYVFEMYGVKFES